MEENQIILAKKGEAWREMGLAIHQTEQNLGLMAQSSLMKWTEPTGPEDISMAEAVLAEIKRDYIAIQNERKVITNNFRAVTDRLMAPEKSLEAPIKSYETTIIGIKKADEVRKAKENAKIQEKKTLIEYVINETAKLDDKFKTFISGKVKIAYEFALGEGNITFAGKDAYLKKIMTKVTVNDFLNSIKAPALVYVTKDEFNEIIAEHCVLEATPEQYVGLFQSELTKRFSDYAIAVNNKQHALELSKNEAIAKAKEQADELKNKQAASALATMAVETPVVQQDFKDLKKPWRIAMEENPENAIKILGAVVANWEKARYKIGVKKWFQFSVANAIVCLEKLKNEDIAFQPNGIIFEQYDKL